MSTTMFRLPARQLIKATQCRTSPLHHLFATKNINVRRFSAVPRKGAGHVPYIAARSLILPSVLLSAGLIFAQYGYNQQPLRADEVTEQLKVELSSQHDQVGSRWMDTSFFLKKKKLNTALCISLP